MNKTETILEYNKKNKIEVLIMKLLKSIYNNQDAIGMMSMYGDLYSVKLKILDNNRNNVLMITDDCASFSSVNTQALDCLVISSSIYITQPDDAYLISVGFDRAGLNMGYEEIDLFCNIYLKSQTEKEFEEYFNTIKNLVDKELGFGYEPEEENKSFLNGKQ